MSMVIVDFSWVSPIGGGRMEQLRHAAWTGFFKTLYIKGIKHTREQHPIYRKSAD